MLKIRNLLLHLQRRVRGLPSLDEELNSIALRTKFAQQHKILVGLYSYGCFSRKRIDPHTTVGRYCSFASTANVFNRNHGLSFIGTNAYLYNSKLGVVDKQMIDFAPCEIGDDVWVGHNATIVPGATKIGRGAVVAAGAIVTRNVPPYAIVAGNPGKIIAYRFPSEVISEIEKTKWWLLTPDEIRAKLQVWPDLFFQPSIALTEQSAFKV